MAGSDKQKKKKSGMRRKRERTPLVSVLAVAALLVVCVIFVSVRYKGESDGGDAVTENTVSEQIIRSQPPETTIVVEVDEPPADVEETPVPKVPAVKVRGIYIDAWSASVEGSLTQFIEICSSSEINAIVIDVKDDFGKITFISDNDSLSAASSNKIPNIEQVLSRLKEHGIYVIARLVCFKDPLCGKLNPELAIHDKAGDTWKDTAGMEWLDPYNAQSWEYIATVAKEAARVGFDEIQLDYVRFPAEGNLGDMDFGAAANEKTKAEIIGDFLGFIRDSLATTPAWLSADAFGIIAVSEGDFENIGQDLDILLQSADYVCPMIYPSHFANKRQNGVGQIINDVLFEIPDIEPYKVVFNILQTVRNRLSEDENNAGIRPYLQAFTASYLESGYYQTYTAQQVYEQIQAVYDTGFDEWILWNPSGDINIYENVRSLISSENSAGSSSGTPAVNNA